MILQKKLNFFFIVHFIYYCSKCVMSAPEAPVAPEALLNILIFINTHRGVTTEYLFEVTNDDVRRIDETMRTIYNTINVINAASDAAVAAAAAAAADAVDSATTATATASAA
jgi:hypothetical protein